MVPASGDAAANLHDYFFGIRDGKVETVWPIEARGAIK
jgi:3-hydroxy-D-aspartate aldolase